MSPRLGIWALGVAMALAAPAVAARGFVEDDPIAPFSLKSYRGDLFFESQYRNEDQTRGPFRLKTTTTDLLFREGVDLSLHGYVYHPKLMDFSGSFRLGFAQDDVHVNDLDQSSEAFLLGYNIQTLLLKDKPVSALIFASRTDDILNRAFASPVHLQDQVEGFELRYRGPITAELHYEHRTKHEDGDFRVDDADTDYLRLDVEDRRNLKFITRATYEHQQTQETNSFTGGGGSALVLGLPDTRDEINITNQWLFGGGLQPNQLNSQLRLLHREGFYQDDGIFLAEHLSLIHTRTFSTYYRGVFNSESTAGLDTSFLEGEVGFHKKIYDSLDIDGHGLFRDQEEINGSEKDMGAFLDLDYHKRTPIGLYKSSLNLSREYVSEEFSGGIRNIRGESIVLTGIVPVQLRQLNILPGSIVVWNATRTGLPFIEGFDYTISTLGAATFIARTPGSTIPEGQPIIVDYTTNAPTQDDFHRDRFVWRHRIELRPIPAAVYGELQITDETLDSGDNATLLESDHALIGGAEYRIGPLFLNGEYETRELRLVPSFDAYRLRASFNHNFNPTVALNISGGYEMLTYKDGAEFGLGPGRDFLETYTANFGLSSKIQRNLLIHLDGSYYQTKGRQNDSLARIGPTLTWKYADLDLSLTGWVGRFTQERDEGFTTFIGVNLKRNF